MTCVKQLLSQIEHTKLATLPDASLQPATTSNADPFGEESKGAPAAGGVGDELDFLSDQPPPQAAAQAFMAAPKPAIATPTPAPAGPAFKTGIADPFNAPARNPQPKPTAPVTAASASADPFANIGGAQNINANTLFANLGGSSAQSAFQADDPFASIVNSSAPA